MIGLLPANKPTKLRSIFRNLSLTQVFSFLLIKAANISFGYYSIKGEHQFFNDGKNLILEGDFGTINYNNETYLSTHIEFFRPSAHTISNKRLPLEIQVHHKSKDNKDVVISVFFRSSDLIFSPFLNKIGFNTKDLKKQKPFIFTHINEKIHLSEIINAGKDFFIYNALNSKPPCQTPTTYFLMTDVLIVSKEQLDIFPEIIRNQGRKIQDRLNRTIYSTFGSHQVQLISEEVQEKQEYLYYEVEMQKIFEQIEANNTNVTVLTGNKTETNGKEKVCLMSKEELIEKIMHYNTLMNFIEPKLVDPQRKYELLSAPETKNKKVESSTVNLNLKLKSFLQIVNSIFNENDDFVDEIDNLHSAFITKENRKNLREGQSIN